MSSSLPFDTHAFIKDLIIKDEIVTKQYLDEKLKDLDTKFEIRMKELENTLTMRMGAMLIVGITIVATLVKILQVKITYL